MTLCYCSEDKGVTCPFHATCSICGQVGIHKITCAVPRKPAKPYDLPHLNADQKFAVALGFVVVTQGPRTAPKLTHGGTWNCNGKPLPITIRTVRILRWRRKRIAARERIAHQMRLHQLSRIKCMRCPRPLPCRMHYLLPFGIRQTALGGWNTEATT